MAQGFLSTMKKFFGFKEGQTPMEFGKEVLALSHEEKLEFHAMLLAYPGGEFVCDLPAKTAPKA